MWDALSENLKIEYQHYEVEFLWMIDYEDSEALIGCQDLASRFPSRNIRIERLPIGPITTSPKTFKLIEGFKRAQGEILIALDDDTALPKRGLETALPFLEKPNVGVVFGIPYYCSFQNFWSSMVSSFVNANSTWIYIPYTKLMDPFAINGMFFSFKREVYDSVDGFNGIEDCICDDYAMAERMIANNLKLVQAPLLHPIRIHIKSAAEYFAIVRRWFVFTRASVMTAKPKNLLTFYLVIFVPTFFPLLIFAVPWFIGTVSAAVAAVIYAASYAVLLWLVNVRFLRRATPLKRLPLLLLTNLLSPLQIVLTLTTTQKVNWRGNIMKVSPNGKFSIVRRRAYPDLNRS